MPSDPLYESLSPQQWRVWRVLCDAEAHSIDELYRQARPLDKAKRTDRYKQQVVGAVLVRINAELREKQSNTRALPGEPRRTYQLRLTARDA